MLDDRRKDYTDFFCICCGQSTKQIGMGIDEEIINREHKLEDGMYDNSIVDSITAGYGSNRDGDIYYISVCDQCVTKALEDGRLLYKSNYMGDSPLKTHLDKWDDGYSKRVRDNNIDDLLK